MRKYKWPLHKALEFLNTRRPNLEIRASFYEQLRVLEENILRNPQYKFRFPGPSEEIKSEETMVSNTFENARAFVLAPKLLPSMEPQIKNHPKIKWADESPNTEKHQLVEAIMETLLDPQNKTKDSKKDAKTPQKSSIKKSSLSFKKENEPSILERKKENPTESPKKQPQNNSFIAAEYFFPFLPSWESRKQELKNNGRKWKKQFEGKGHWTWRSSRKQTNKVLLWTRKRRHLWNSLLASREISGPALVYSWGAEREFGPRSHAPRSSEAQDGWLDRGNSNENEPVHQKHREIKPIQLRQRHLLWEYQQPREYSLIERPHQKR